MSEGNEMVAAARAQSLFRDVNDRVVEIACPERNGLLTLLCECADVRCVAGVLIPTEVYERVRRIPTHFLVRPGHVVPEVERVVDHGEGFRVVEKFGAAGITAVERHRREASMAMDTVDQRC